MAKFRKKPVVIEAYQLTDELVEALLKGETEIEDDFHTWINKDGSADDPHVSIQTLEGTMIARKGDWIITGMNGERYPCKMDIFTKTYEPVEESNG